MNNYPVNRTDFRVIRGVQNEILFFVRDLDRNPVSTSGFQTVTITIVDPASATLLLTRNLAVVDPVTALYMLTILPSEAATWAIGPLQWSLQVVRSDGSSVMLWTDMNFNPHGVLQVANGPAPTVAAATVLDPTTFTVNTGVLYSANLPGAAQLGFQNGMHSFAIYTAAFSGTVEVDASLMSHPSGSDSDWFSVSTTPFTTSSGVNLVTLAGNYLWLRVRISPVLNNPGSVTQILYKN